jgi:2-dehydro-3-deoxy-L-rhamnonate dehydrogenase (NAD+)
MNQIDLTGRTAVVTGAARGIGLTIAERLLKSGARVSIWDRDREVVETSAKDLGALAHALDVSDYAAVQAAVEETESRLGSIDILVTSAAIGGATTTVVDYPVDVWRHVLDVNLTGVFLCCRAVVPVMQKRNYGRVINIASIAGKEGNPNASAYSASKAGVIALTKTLGKELATTGVRVNCITPGVVRTDMLKQATQQHIDYMLSKVPMGRFGTVEEMGSLVAWLASEECSFSTGAVFDISGGRATY